MIGFEKLAHFGADLRNRSVQFGVIFSAHLLRHLQFFDGVVEHVTGGTHFPDGGKISRQLHATARHVRDDLLLEVHAHTSAFTSRRRKNVCKASRST